ncbi:MAG: hypothetical protein EB051_02890, partial [Chlamydiia bacterium]|nr:hypothetical protein [Chlamydiia bacterium]
MDKQKRWQLFLISGVIFLTVFNILPTVFYYAKPLKSPINPTQSEEIASSIVDRMNNLEEESVAWVESFCKLLKIKPSRVFLDPKQPEFIQLTCSTKQDADIFKYYLPRAGALIPFVPGQLSLYEPDIQNEKQITIRRKIPIHIDPKEIKQYFQYARKIDDNGQLTSLYQALIHDRALEIALSLGGVGENQQLIQSLIKSKDDPLNLELSLQLCENIQSFVKAFGDNSQASKRFFASLTQIEDENKQELIQKLLIKLESIKNTIVAERKGIAGPSLADSPAAEQINTLSQKENNLQMGIALLKKNQATLALGQSPWTYASAAGLLKTGVADKNSTSLQTISLEGKNPLFESISIDWKNDQITITAYKDVTQTIAELDLKKSTANPASQIVYNQIAYVNRKTAENIIPFEEKFTITLSTLGNSNSFLAFRLGQIAEAQAQSVQQAITNTWKPTHPDLTSDTFPIWDYTTYSKLAPQDKKLGLLIYSPVIEKTSPENGFRMNSIYVVAKGLERIIKKYEQNPES